MASKEDGPPAAATTTPTGTPTQPRFFSRLSPFQWFVRLIPAITFFFYTYSQKGPFQPATCITFNYGCPRAPAQLTGIYNAPEHYNPVLQFYAGLFASHEDLGGSLAVFIDNKVAIDVFAGSKDLARTQVYDNQTLQQVYSSGKAVEGIVIARLVQRGLLDYEEKIARYWPEFGINDKEDVTLTDLMVHESGVNFLDDEEKLMSWDLIADEKAFSEKLASQKHQFGGNRTRAYHAVSRGWYLNEIVKRVDPKGRTIGQLAQEELMKDYEDMELYYSKLPKETDWEERLSPFHDYPVLRIVGRLILPKFIQNHKSIGFPNMKPLHKMVRGLLRTSSITAKTMTPTMLPYARSFRTKEAHQTESTSFSLKTNAHSLAKLAAMMANQGQALKNDGGEPDLLSKETYARATTFHSANECRVTSEVLPMSKGGWVKHKDYMPGSTIMEGVEVQGWGGAGGSLIVWIEELGIGFAYVTNAFGPPESVLGDYRARTLLELVVKARKQELGLLAA